MKKTLVLVFGLTACVFSAQAQFFTNGNLAVLEVGGPGQYLNSSGAATNGSAVTIVQFTTNGQQVSSLTLPTNGANAFTLYGSFTEGFMSLSPGGNALVIPGYNGPTPLGISPESSQSTNVPRAVALVDAYGNYSMPIANTNVFSASTIRGAAFDGTSNFWVAGSGSVSNASVPGAAYTNSFGVVYVGTPGSTGGNVRVGITGSGNERCLNVYNNTLYVSTGSATHGIWAVPGTGFPPTTGGNTNTVNTIPMYSGSSPYDFVFDPSNTTCYVADNNFGIVKFTNSGSAWVSNYTVGLATPGNPLIAASGVTADFTQTPAVVYATTGENISNRLVSFVDTGASATVTMLAQGFSGAGGTNLYKGVRFVPTSVPTISSQPASVVVSADGSATFSVTATDYQLTGTPALSYQWYTNGGAIVGATSSSVTFSPVTTFLNGTLVDVVVTNVYGAVTSSNATLTVNANYFIPGNLAVVSVGGPGQFVSSTDAGNTVSIVQFTTNGQEVGTLALPSTGPEAFTLDGSATEGYMQLTENGQYLVLGGYNAPAGTVTSNSGPADVASTYVPRAVVTIDGYGNYAMPISNPNIFSTYNIRGAVFDGTNNFWVSGSGAPANPKGIIYVGQAGDSGANAVQVEIGFTGTGNERCLNIFNNTIFVSTGASSHGIWTVPGDGTFPPTTGPTNTYVTISQPSSTGAYDFAINSASNQAYVADGSIGGIIRYTNSGSGFVSNAFYGVGGTGTDTNVDGLTVDWSQNPPVLYATTGALAGNRLVSIVDNGSGSPFTLLATASSSASGSNYFRGVRFVPGVVPSITNEPQPFTQDAGGDATFTVGASGTPLLEYQWSTNGVAVSGATDSSFTLTSLTTSQNGTIVSVVVSNNYGTATSTGAELSVQPPGAPLNVSISPTSQTVNAGSAAVFNANAVGTALTFIWKLNGVQLTDGGSVSGSSTATLTINPAYATYDGTYTVIASNSFGIAPGNNSGTLTVIDPVIITQPVGSTNLPSTSGPTSTTLSVTAAGAPPLTYQWVSNGVPVSGATSSTLSVANSGATVSASYYVLITNALGSSIQSATTVVSFTPLLLYDTFSYPNGDLFGDAGSPWTDINGTNPEIVTNGRVQINQTNFTTDAQSLFSQPVSNTVVWTSFIINLSVLPTNAGGVYFANIEDTTFNFFGRLFTLTSNNPSYTPNINNIAFPGTYRLGIANEQTDSSSTSSTGPTAVAPLDLAPGIDYQVVYFMDLVNGYSSLSINPASLSDAYPGSSQTAVNSGPATDTITHLTNAIAAYGLRQREGEGVMTLDNLEVSFDWNGAGSGYSAVTTGITAAKPVIGLQPASSTNYAGNPLTLEVAASGIGTAGNGLAYQWYQNSAALTDGNGITGSATQTLNISSLVDTNSGVYYVVVTGAAGSVTSSNAIVQVNTAVEAPVFTLQPASDVTNSEGGTVTFTSLANGTGPISYAWYYSNSFGVNQVGSGADLTLTGLETNESGIYYVIATGGTGLQAQSSNLLLTVTGPNSVTIGYLRSLLNPTTFDPSDTTTLFSITGVITTATNQTTGDTASYYIQDATGGINLFVTDGQDFRPTIGDLVTATGTLSTYADNYELDVSEGTADYVDSIIGTNAPLPTPILFPWGNNPGPLSASIATNIEGSVVMLTNLYFEAGGGTNRFASGTDYIVTNNTGESYTIFVSDQDTNYVTGQLIPAFAQSISGPLIQDDLVVGISFTVYSNLVVGSSTPPVTIGTIGGATTTAGGTNGFTLTWTAVPSASYSIKYSTNLLTPLTNVAVSGLVFTNTDGTYTLAGPTNGAAFYQITSP